MTGYLIAVRAQSSHGSTSHLQSTALAASFAMALAGVGSETFDFGDQWRTTQHLHFGPHGRNPARKRRDVGHIDDVPALFGGIPSCSQGFDSVPFSAKGVTRLIPMRESSADTAANTADSFERLPLCLAV